MQCMLLTACVASPTVADLSCICCSCMNHVDGSMYNIILIDIICENLQISNLVTFDNSALIVECYLV